MKYAADRVYRRLGGFHPARGRQRAGNGFSAGERRGHDELRHLPLRRGLQNRAEQLPAAARRDGNAA